MIVVAIVTTVAIVQLPAIGAGALLFPARRLSRLPTPAGCIERQFTAAVALVGWHCRAASQPGAITIIYLHGIADNRDSAAGAIGRFTARGYDVVAYDARGHGRSSGDHCTYGYFEKDDLRRVIAQVSAENVVLIGHSLGAAVALQAAAEEPHVRAVVAASTFADLRSIATDRARQLFFPSFAVRSALDRVEHDGGFPVDAASPLRAAAAVHVPVFLIHGAQDRDTDPQHSRRVFDALQGRKRLEIVPAAGHNDVMREDVWQAVERWLDVEVRGNGVS